MGLSVTISAADARDAEQILKLQYLCYQSEAELYGDWSIEPLTQSLDALRAELEEGTGSWPVSATRSSPPCGPASTRTAPYGSPSSSSTRGCGGTASAAGSWTPSSATSPPGPHPSAKRFRLFTGHRSEVNLRLYRSKGYAQVATRELGPGSPW